MKAIANGKTYNTETAERVCGLDCNYHPGDFQYHDTDLYRTKKGAFFIAGKGGAASMWAQPCSGGGRMGGAGVRPVSNQEARDYMEAAGCDEENFAAVGLKVEEA